MLEEETDGWGGENAGDAEIPVTLNNGAFSSAGVANPMAARLPNGDVCASGARKSGTQAADTDWVGAWCRWQGGSVGAQSTATHAAVHCRTPKHNARMSKTTN